MIVKGNIPSIQCKMRKVDGFSLIFIDFYVPAHTPRLNSSETSLQLSLVIAAAPCYIASARTTQKTHLQQFLYCCVMYL
jgi:hypothetical protein